MSTATRAGTPAFCKQPGRCMIGCHDCGCDMQDGPYYCERDHPNSSFRAALAAAVSIYGRDGIAVDRTEGK